MEKDIQTAILKYLKETFPSAVVWKIHQDKHFGMIGLPDIFFAFKGRAYFFEVKQPGKRPTALQAYVLDRLNHNDITSVVVTSVRDVRKTLGEES